MSLRPLDSSALRLNARDLWRLFSKIARSASGCWEWTGSRGSKGYGRFAIKDELHSAHRVTYRAFVGAIPGGLQIDHLCRNRCCVNPAHLEAVSARENVSRGQGRPAILMKQTECKRGHAFTNENTIVDKYGRHCRECARMHARHYRAMRGQRSAA